MNFGSKNGLKKYNKNWQKFGEASPTSWRVRKPWIEAKCYSKWMAKIERQIKSKDNIKWCI